MMTNKEILEKAIQKSIDGGWDANVFGGVDLWNDLDDYPLEKEQVIKLMLSNGDQINGYRLFIFNHDFAKALWGEDADTFNWDDDMLLDWQFHLMQMVISEDPIKYLGDNI